MKTYKIELFPQDARQEYFHVYAKNSSCFFCSGYALVETSHYKEEAEQLCKGQNAKSRYTGIFYNGKRIDDSEIERLLPQGNLLETRSDYSRNVINDVPRVKI